MPEEFEWLRRRKKRFQWHQYIPSLRYHQVTMMINICAILFWSILLAACTSSNGLRNVYLLSLSYKGPTTDASSDSLILNSGIVQAVADQLAGSNVTIQEIRVGYLAMCLALESGIWICNSNPDKLATELRALTAADPLNMFRLAQDVRAEILFYPLIIIAVVFIFISILLLATLPGWHIETDSEGSEREVKPLPSRLRCLSALGLTGMAALLGFASAFWQHIGSSGITTLTRLLTYDMVEARVGVAGMILGWLGASSACVTAIGLIMILWIRVHTQMVT